MTRIVAVARMQTANRLWSCYPALTLVLGLGSALLAIGSGSTGGGGLGGLLFVVLTGAHFVGMTQFFPFCAGLSVTRRDFLAGTALVAVVQALVLGLGLLALAGLEGATGGWGAGVSSFRNPLAGENIAVQWLANVTPLLAYAACGILAGAVVLRWGRIGIVVASIALGLLLGLGVGLVAAVLGTDPGAAPTPAAGGPPLLLLLILGPLVAALVLGGLAHLVLRRATP